MSDAMKDAKVRAEALTKAVGSSLGSLVNVRRTNQITTRFNDDGRLWRAT